MWPTVANRESSVGDAVVRVKVATVTLATFPAAAAGWTIDTTNWARSVQPARTSPSCSLNAAGALAHVRAAVVGRSVAIAAVGVDTPADLQFVRRRMVD